MIKKFFLIVRLRKKGKMYKMKNKKFNFGRMKKKPGPG